MNATKWIIGGLVTLASGGVVFGVLLTNVFSPLTAADARRVDANTFIWLQQQLQQLRHTEQSNQLTMTLLESGVPIVLWGMLILFGIVAAGLAIYLILRGSATLIATIKSQQTIVETPEMQNSAQAMVLEMMAQLTETMRQTQEQMGLLIAKQNEQDAQLKQAQSHAPKPQVSHNGHTPAEAMEGAQEIWYLPN